MKKQKGIRIFFKRYGEDYAFLLPYYLLFCLFTLVPVIISIFFSFTYFNILEPPRFLGLDNYFQLFLDDPIFLTALGNTLLMSVIVGPAGFFLSLGLAWLLNEFSHYVRTFFTFLLYAPALCGGATAIWVIIYSGDTYGILNSLLLSVGIINEPAQWLTDPTYMMTAAIVAILWSSLGTSFLSLIAGFQNIDKTLYEAGAIDGIKNRWQELWNITLPTLKPQLMFAAVMSITGSFGMGDQITALFGFPSTNYALHTLVHHLQDFGTVRFEMGYASAIATVLFLIMIISNEIVQKILKRWSA